MDKKVMVVSIGGYGDVVEYGVREIESLDYDVFRDWEEIGEGVWCEENDIVVVGKSEEDCVKKLKEVDVDFGLEYVYEKSEKDWMCDWVLGLKSSDE